MGILRGVGWKMLVCSSLQLLEILCTVEEILGNFQEGIERLKSIPVGSKRLGSELGRHEFCTVVQGDANCDAGSAVAWEVMDVDVCVVAGKPGLVHESP